jgi:phosphate transport system ATP-binding protein
MSPAELRLAGVEAWYGSRKVLFGVDLLCPAGAVTAILGSAGAAKSTLLRVVNRLADDQPGFRWAGQVYLDDREVGRDPSPVALRREIGMVFDQPTPFRMSIYDNVAFPLRISGMTDHGRVAARVEEALRDAGLWDDLADRLDTPALALEPGQQQCLCIARALALDPRVLLVDEPTATLGPVASALVEEILLDLRGRITLVVVTRDAQQAGRLAEHTAFMKEGRVLEVATTEELFTRPRHAETAAYLSRRFASR